MHEHEHFLPALCDTCPWTSNSYSSAAYNQANSITDSELGHVSYLRNTRLAGVALDSPALYIVRVPVSSALLSIFFWSCDYTVE